MAKKQKRIVDIYELDVLYMTIKELLKDNSQKEKMIQKLKRKLNGKTTSNN